MSIQIPETSNVHQIQTCLARRALRNEKPEGLLNDQRNTRHVKRSNDFKNSIREFMNTRIREFMNS